jgi:hypothetical protein
MSSSRNVVIEYDLRMSTRCLRACVHVLTAQVGLIGADHVRRRQRMAQSR